MGKKRVIKPTKEALLKEKERIEEKVARGILKSRKKITRGKLYIKATYNNMIITVTDEEGNVVFWSSAGHVGFKGTKKGTPFAATKVAEVVSSVLQKTGMREIAVFIRGVGQGREAALRSLANRGVNIISIKDVTPIPHNGPKAKKPRKP
ncbi:MAG: 30S ribosomal protein S11 [Candidatus Pacebacteria bacterium]|jgi:small subunit ribosomal protein S11|nr:30S ribosomal protein S11 [Candidatus Paceibacterota bacterium]